MNKVGTEFILWIRLPTSKFLKFVHQKAGFADLAARVKKLKLHCFILTFFTNLHISLTCIQKTNYRFLYQLFATCLDFFIVKKTNMNVHKFNKITMHITLSYVLEKRFSKFVGGAHEVKVLETPRTFLPSLNLCLTTCSRVSCRNKTTTAKL